MAGCTSVAEETRDRRCSIRLPAREILIFFLLFTNSNILQAWFLGWGSAGPPLDGSIAIATWRLGAVSSPGGKGPHYLQLIVSISGLSLHPKAIPYAAMLHAIGKRIGRIASW